MNEARSRMVLERLTVEVMARIRPSCLELSEEELLHLATGIATLELKYLGEASTSLGNRKPDDRKVE